MLHKRFFSVWLPFITVFSLSLLGHASTITRPLIGHHDYLNGHLLTTALIWSREGIFKHAFVPVYSFNNDVPIEPGLGVEGKNGRMYYVSYPPFVFIFIYLLSKIPFIGLSDSTPRIASLLVYTVTSFLLFWYLHKKYSRLSALFAFFIFSVFPISVYFLGSVFFVDILILPLWFGSFLLFLSLISNPYKPRTYLAFFCLLFLITFTEWTGILLAGSIFLFVLIFSSRFGWNRRFKFTFLLNTALFPLLALVLTLALFLSQIEVHKLASVLNAKISFRSNASVLFTSKEPLTATVSFLRDFYKTSLFHIRLGFGTHFLPVILLILAVLIGIRTFSKVQKRVFHDFFIVLIFFGFPSLLHFLLLSQFHIAHDFGYLYILFPVLFLFVWFVQISSILIKKYIKGNKGSFVQFALLYGIILIIIAGSYNSYQTYLQKWVWLSPEKVKLYERMRDVTNEHDLILTNYESTPQYWFYVQRNLVGHMLGEQVTNYTITSGKVRTVYYMSDAPYNTQVSCGGREIVYKNMLYMCKLN